MTTPINDDGPDFTRRIRTDAAREVERLVAANAASNETMTRLVDKVREDSAKRERKIELLENESRQIRRLLIMVGVAIVLLLCAGVANLYNTTQARKNIQQTEVIARDAANTNQLLVSCFDVTSECSRLNNENQKKLLDEIKLYELTAFYCIRNNPTTIDPEGEKFLACVKRLYPSGPTLDGR